MVDTSTRSWPSSLTSHHKPHSLGMPRTGMRPPRAAADDVWDATAKATSSLEDLYNKIKVLSGKLRTKSFNKFMEQVKLPQVSITVVQDPADEAFSPDDLKIKSHMPRPHICPRNPNPQYY